jgi:hypothetical protein
VPACDEGRQANGRQGLQLDQFLIYQSHITFHHKAFLTQTTPLLSHKQNSQAKASLSLTEK